MWSRCNGCAGSVSSDFEQRADGGGHGWPPSPAHYEIRPGVAAARSTCGNPPPAGLQCPRGDRRGAAPCPTRRAIVSWTSPLKPARRPVNRVVVLGSTGSIGTSTSTSSPTCRSRIEVVGLSAHSRLDLLVEQAHALPAALRRRHRPRRPPGSTRRPAGRAANCCAAPTASPAWSPTRRRRRRQRHRRRGRAGRAPGRPWRPARPSPSPTRKRSSWPGRWSSELAAATRRPAAARR